MNGDLRVESPKIQSQFCEMMQKNHLPWDLYIEGGHWQINNADGEIVIDGGGTALTLMEAAAVVCAVNTCGGFQSSRVQ